MNKFILSIQNPIIFKSKFSGGKGSNLARLLKNGFNVPPFFIISSSLYEYIIKINEIDRLIKKIASQKLITDFRQIQSKIFAAEVPEFIIKQINYAFQNLILNIPAKTVAVRSSALAEDLRDRSFAGQLESYLNIQDEKNLLDSIKKCWASFWNERVCHYISISQAKFHPQPIAVIVQQMVPAEYAGVCFTVDPTDAKQQWMMIEVHPGIGEDIVAGKVNPVQYRVHRKTLTIRKGSDDKQQLFDQEKIHQLVRTCRKIEIVFGASQDIEWTFYRDQFYFLQSRPITTAARKPASSSEKLWSNYFFGERFPQPVSPLGWSILKPLIEKNAFREPLNFLGFHYLARSRITKCFYGRLYTRLKVFQALHSLLPTAYVSSDKRKLFYDKPVSLGESLIIIFKNILPILNSLISTTDWIPPIHLRNWKRFLNYYLLKIQALNKIKLQILSDEELWRLNFQSERLSDRLLKLHRWSITFAELIYHFLIFLTRKWLPQIDAVQIVVVLHRGIAGNKTVEMNIDLWRLSRQLKDNRFHPSVGKWNRFLMSTQGWKSFIQKFGHRSTSLDIAVPTFADDTKYILELAQQYLKLKPVISPETKQEKYEQLREERFKAVVQNMSKLPFGYLKKNFFKILLDWSEQFMLLRENQRYYWHHALAINRKIFLELGRRFFDRGWLEQKEHIFFLTRKEIKNIIFSKNFISKTEIEKRYHLNMKWQKIQPPALIDELNPFQTDIGITNEKLEGIAASPGVVTGKARVLTSLGDMAQLKRGEILVVPTTDPGWTPLFSIIKGLVMEVGGVLSHGSIIAREFGIPAVTNTQNVTTRIRTGMNITVDGNKGVIWINNDQISKKHSG